MQDLNSINKSIEQEEYAEQLDISSNRGLAVLSYIGIFALVSIFLSKKSKYLRFHANQGLILFIISALANILVYIVTAIITAINLSQYDSGYNIATTGSSTSSIQGVNSFPMFAVSIFVIVFSIIGIINAAKGNQKELPIIGKFRILKDK